MILGFLAGVAIVLVQKQLSKGQEVEVKSSLTSTIVLSNGTDDYDSSYDAEEFYTEIEQIDFNEKTKRIDHGSKTIKKGRDKLFKNWAS